MLCSFWNQLRHLTSLVTFSQHILTALCKRNSACTEARLEVVTDSPIHWRENSSDLEGRKENSLIISIAYLSITENMASSGPRVITARRQKDGFTFNLSVDHIIEQTLLKEYNSPNFHKTTIRIEDAQSDGESEASDSNDSTKLNSRPKGVPIKLQLKRQYAEDTPSPDSDSNSRCGSSINSCDEPLDMSTKRVKKTKPAVEEQNDYSSITSIPESWIMRGLSREEHKKFQSAVSNASLSPYQRRNKFSES